MVFSFDLICDKRAFGKRPRQVTRVGRHDFGKLQLECRFDPFHSVLCVLGGCELLLGRHDLSHEAFQTNSTKLTMPPPPAAMGSEPGLLQKCTLVETEG
jgi:hypothetical protein